MPLLSIASCKPLRRSAVEAREDLAAAIDQRRLDAEAVEDVGEFDRDVAAAGNDDRLRQDGQIEGLVGEDAVLVAGQRRMRVGPAAGGDQDLVGGDGAVLALDADRCAGRPARRGNGMALPPAFSTPCR